jgi:hypothetical protein
MLQVRGHILKLYVIIFVVIRLFIAVYALVRTLFFTLSQFQLQNVHDSDIWRLVNVIAKSTERPDAFFFIIGMLSRLPVSDVICPIEDLNSRLECVVFYASPSFSDCSQSMTDDLIPTLHELNPQLWLSVKHLGHPVATHHAHRSIRHNWPCFVYEPVLRSLIPSLPPEPLPTLPSLLWQAGWSMVSSQKKIYGCRIAEWSSWPIHSGAAGNWSYISFCVRYWSIYSVHWDWRIRNAEELCYCSCPVRSSFLGAPSSKGESQCQVATAAK